MDSSNGKMPLYAAVSNREAPSPVSDVGENDSTNDVNCPFIKGDSLFLSSKELENDFQMLGKKILQHEINLQYLKHLRNTCGLRIAEMEVTLVNHLTEGKAFTRNKKRMDETYESIFQYEKSAASIYCNLKLRAHRRVEQISLMEDCLGAVVTLGKVEDINVSRLLSEYLGINTMLALVCKTYEEGVKALETYDEQGKINKRTGLHGFAASNGRSLDGRFNVICLENLRPYAGEFLHGDPQKRLALLKPSLPNGESPQGFLGFAVNMINIANEHMFYVTSNGDGLRETLFYHLFSRLQVYQTRKDMWQALPCLSDGAISLDGGIMRSNGMFTFGPREKIDIYFPKYRSSTFLSEYYIEAKNEIEELKWKRGKMMEDIKKEEGLLADARVHHEAKKMEFIKSMAKCAFDQMQQSAQSKEGSSTSEHPEKNHD